MTIHNIGPDFYIIDLQEVIDEVNKQCFAEARRLGVFSEDGLVLNTIESNRLLIHYTLAVMSAVLSESKNKRNTFFYTSEEVPSIFKNISKVFPFLVIMGDYPFQQCIRNPGANKELYNTLRSERYNIDFSKYTFSKVKLFCKKNKLDVFLDGFDRKGNVLDIYKIVSRAGERSEPLKVLQNFSNSLRTCE